MITTDLDSSVSFSHFLADLKNTLKSVFYERDYIEKFIQKRGFPALVLRDIMAKNPLSVAIPEAYGGRGAKVKECLGVLDAAAYESLPLSLAFGINIGLFLEPVAKYAREEVKEGIFKRFLTRQNMGGLMITEPDYGSDALNMTTSYTRQKEAFHIQGTKHWQGLTGMADYWIMTARAQLSNGELGRDIGFFICDVQQAEQQIQVTEYYHNIGLYPISYGKNKVDIWVPESFQLQAESTGLKLMMDLLHRSRFQIPGMGMGFIRRMLDEAIRQCNTRFVAGQPLMALDQVKFQVARIQSAYTIASGMCARSAQYSGIENNLAADAIEANSMKAYVTDLMQEAAQTLTQLMGANGYKAEQVGARGIMDSRPFQIFEGANEMLYSQIGEMAQKTMGRMKWSKLQTFLESFERTRLAAGHFAKLLNFQIDANLAQRKVVDIGKMISRVVAAAQLLEMEERGFRSDLIDAAMDSIQREITTLLSSYRCQTRVIPIEDYQSGSSWLDFS